MKTNIFLLLILLSILLCGTGWSLTITIDGSTKDVGDVDEIYVNPYTGQVAETGKLAGEEKEFEWVASILGDSIQFVTKTELSNGTGWYETNEAGTWAYNLTAAPDYFVIKTGKVDVKGLENFLFVNNSLNTWAVVDLDDVHVSKIDNIEKISHVSQYNNTAPVPEPATMVLLGSGLLGMGIFGRKKASRK